MRRIVPQVNTTSSTELLAAVEALNGGPNTCIWETVKTFGNSTGQIALNGQVLLGYGGSRPNARATASRGEGAGDEASNRRNGAVDGDQEKPVDTTLGANRS